MARQGREQQPDRTTNPGAQNDNPNHAPESGEPSESARTHGMPINKDGTPAGKDAAPSARNNPNDKAPESGRQQEAAP